MWTMRGDAGRALTGSWRSVRVQQMQVIIVFLVIAQWKACLDFKDGFIG